MKAYHVHDGTWRRMVYARTQKEAARLLRCTEKAFRHGGGTYTDPENVAVAASEPGRVWRRRMDLPGPQPWVHAEGRGA